MKIINLCEGKLIFVSLNRWETKSQVCITCFIDRNELFRCFNDEFTWLYMLLRGLWIELGIDPNLRVWLIEESVGIQVGNQGK